MNKDAYYFPHFSNARSDRKVQRLREELGIEGYGIFFMLLEVLRDQSDLRYPMTDIDLLAREFVTSEPKVRTVICNYNLFNVDEEQKFFSPKMIVYLQPYFEKRDRARNAAIIMHEKYHSINDLSKSGDANAEQMQSKCCASKVKQSKAKQSKEEDKNAPRSGLVFNEDEYPHLKDDAFSQALAGFVDMRKSIKKPLSTQRALNLVLTKLAKYNLQTAIAMLDQSTQSSWLSVFELRLPVQSAGKYTPPKNFIVSKEAIGG